MPAKGELEQAEFATNISTTANVTNLTADETSSTVARFCRPRLMPVSMPAPLGPKLFILGEPVLHRYYTVFDWDGPRVGMAVANTPRNLVDRSQITDRIGSLPKDMDVYLMQQSVSTSSPKTPEVSELDNIDDDGLAMIQIRVEVSMRVEVI